MEWLVKLKEMKQSSGLTTKEISDGSGIPEPTLEKLFSGATKDPKLNTVMQLVHFLGYTLDDLVPAQKKQLLFRMNPKWKLLVKSCIWLY